MKGLRYALAAWGAAGVCLAGTAAWGAGFAIKEQSPSALGNAFAGATAEAADISYMFFNPAGLTRHSGTQFQTGVSYIAPRSEPKDASGSTIAGVPIAGGDGGSDISEDAFVPTLYAMHSLSDRLKLGLGINAPFGLETDYNDDWVGRYHALNSELATININPNVAYKVLDELSLGIGLQAQYADADLSNAVDFGSIGAASGIPFAVPGQQDGKSELEGDDWGFGFNVGAMIEPDERTRIGVAYRSQVAHTLSGGVDFQLDGAGVGQTIQAASGSFTDTDAKASLTTPDMASLGFYHEFNDRWAVMGEAQYTIWSKFDELRIQFDNPAQPDSFTNEDWDDSWFGALGVTYRPQDDLALRAGVAFDESPIPDDTRTPRIPGNDRQWIAIGAHYRPYSWFSVDAGYTHIFVDDSTVSLDATDPGETFRGNLDVEFESAIDIVTVQAVLRF